MKKQVVLKHISILTFLIVASLMTVVDAKILYQEYEHPISGSLNLWEQDEWGHYGCGTAIIRVEIDDITGANRVWYEIWECDHGGKIGWEKIYSGYIYENNDTGNKPVDDEQWIYVYIEN